MREQVKNLTFSLDESPYKYIAHFEDELKSFKLELTKTRTREDWFKQFIQRKNVQKKGSHPDEKKNQKLHLIDNAQLDTMLEENNQKDTLAFSQCAPFLAYNNSHVLPVSMRCSDLQSNQLQITSGVFANISNAITRQKNFASSLALSTRTVNREEPSANATWDKNSNTIPTNTKTLGLESNQLNSIGGAVASLEKLMQQIMSSNALSLPSHGKFVVREEHSANATWDNDFV